MTDPVKWIAEAKSRLGTTTHSACPSCNSRALHIAENGGDYTIRHHPDCTLKRLLDTAPTVAEVRRVGLKEAERIVANPPWSDDRLVECGNGFEMKRGEPLWGEGPARAICAAIDALSERDLP